MEDSVVLVGDADSLTVIRLFYLVHLDEFSLNSLGENLFECIQRYNLDFKDFIVVIGDCNCVFGVVSDNYLHHWHLSINKGSYGQVIEEVSVPIEFVQTLNGCLIICSKL